MHWEGKNETETEIGIETETDGWMNILKTIGCLELKEDYYNCFIL